MSPSIKKKVDKRGGARDGAGRKTFIGGNCKRTQVSLDQETIDFLSEFGSGNVSLGIRLAAARLNGNVGWRNEPVPEKIISSLIDMASWEATIAFHRYLTIEHLLLSVPKLETPQSWMVLPDCQARTVMLEELAKRVAEEMIKTDSPGALIPSKAYTRVVERLKSGVSLISAIEMEQEKSLASQCLEQYGFINPCPESELTKESIQTTI